MWVFVELGLAWAILTGILWCCSSLWQYVPAARAEYAPSRADVAVMSHRGGRETTLVYVSDPAISFPLVAVIAAVPIVVGAIWGGLMPL